MSPARPPEEARCAGEAERTPASAAAARARALPPHDRLVAITGSTGFIGRHLVVALAQAGWRVRLLLRRDPDEPTWRDVCPEIVAGSLGDSAAIDRLVQGASAVVHLAGLIKATSRQRFMAVNHDGAVRMAQAAQRLAPGAHFMMVSSLAAREPMLSDYAASKRAGEQAVLALLGARATVVRPPAVYGPGDRETLLFFKLAERRIVPLLGAPDARAAMIHVRDLSDLIVRLLGQAPDGRTVTAADERLEGYGWKEILSTATAAVGNPGPSFVQAPMAVLRGLACVGDIARVFGSASMLNSQKLRELRHRDWSVSADEHAVPRGWAPALSLREGFSDTVAWYRQAGWLSVARGATPSA